ncbi:hypothetical protein QJS66_14140 [Kocuria rhizophila]|nr:hypothetical protein QJS66_14140 [Kocuria rhizophila]
MDRQRPGEARSWQNCPDGGCGGGACPSSWPSSARHRACSRFAADPPQARGRGRCSPSAIGGA